MRGFGDRDFLRSSQRETPPAKWWLGCTLRATVQRRDTDAVGQQENIRAAQYLFRDADKWCADVR